MEEMWLVPCAVCGEAVKQREAEVFSVGEEPPVDLDPLPQELRTAMKDLLLDNTTLQHNWMNLLPESFDDFRLLALEKRGLNGAAETITICGCCKEALEKNERPHKSMANSLQFGDIPECLRGLRLAELRLLQVYRTCSYILTLDSTSTVSGGNTDWRQRKVSFIRSFQLKSVLAAVEGPRLCCHARRDQSGGHAASSSGRVGGFDAGSLMRFVWFHISSLFCLLEFSTRFGVYFRLARLLYFVLLVFHIGARSG